MLIPYSFPVIDDFKFHNIIADTIELQRIDRILVRGEDHAFREPEFLCQLNRLFESLIGVILFIFFKNSRHWIVVDFRELLTPSHETFLIKDMLFIAIIPIISILLRLVNMIKLLKDSILLTDNTIVFLLLVIVIVAKVYRADLVIDDGE